MTHDRDTGGALRRIYRNGLEFTTTRLPMIYEIINPHDKATFEAPDDEVAALAVMVLGEGYYGAERAGGESVCGIGLFGFCKNSAGLTEENVGQRLDARRADVAAALGSVIYCGAADRAAILAAGGDLAKFNDAKRSSLTNMAGRAHALAEAIRKTL